MDETKAAPGSARGPSPEPIRVLLLARSLESGGSERQLVDLARGVDRTRFAVRLALLYDRGPLREEVAAIAGLGPVALGKSGRWDLAGPLRRLVALIRTERIEAVYSFLDIANLYALAGGRLGGAKVIFGVRSSFMDFAKYDRAEGAVWRLTALASHLADRVIYNSEAGREFSAGRGFSRQNAVVVANGVDVERFSRRLDAGACLRREWGIAPEAPLVGLVGRIDPMKDHETFLRAAALVRAANAGARFVCVGAGPRAYADALRASASRLGLAPSLVWAGPRADMPAVYSALDVLALSSRGEGFPNVVAEAMACGVPCVVTRVGDAARIVGEEGFVVPAGDPGALAQGLQRLLAEPREVRAARGVRCRERIVQEFPLTGMVEATQRQLAAVVGSG